MGQAILVGAGIGALTSALKGQNLLKGAALGGATGAVTGGLGNWMETGSLLGANAAGAEVAKQAMASNLASGATSGAVSGGTSGAVGGGAVAGTPVSSYMQPTTGEIGMANTFNTAGTGYTSAMPESLMKNGVQVAPNLGAVTSEFTNPALSQTLANEASIFNPAGAGGLGHISDAEYQALAQTAQSDPSFLDKIKPYLSGNNVMGAANAAMSYKPTQRPTPQSGHVSQGQAPQSGFGAGGVEGLLAELQKQRQTQRQPISLLVG